MQLKTIINEEELKTIFLKALDYARYNEPFYYPLFLVKIRNKKRNNIKIPLFF